jgi:hypothetical protein
MMTRRRFSLRAKMYRSRIPPRRFRSPLTCFQSTSRASGRSPSTAFQMRHRPLSRLARRKTALSSSACRAYSTRRRLIQPEPAHCVCKHYIKLLSLRPSPFLQKRRSNITPPIALCRRNSPLSQNTTVYARATHLSVNAIHLSLRQTTCFWHNLPMFFVSFKTQFVLFNTLSHFDSNGVVPEL